MNNMLKDIEGTERGISGFSKTPDVDGEGVQVEYKLHNIHLNFLRKLFGVDPNHPDKVITEMLEPEKSGGFRLNKHQYESLKPYIKEEVVDFEKYDFSLDAYSSSNWDWRSRWPIQIKNAPEKIKPFLDEKEQPYYPPLVANKNGQKSLATSLDEKYWEEFYNFRYYNYPLTEFSKYRIDWDAVKHYKRLEWEKAIASPNHVKEFLKSTCLNQFEEIAIGYGPREPIILMTLECFCSQSLEELFADDWGACFLVGTTRNKYGIVELHNEYFVEVTCGDYLTAPNKIGVK
jgi:hypothetical protein